MLHETRTYKKTSKTLSEDISLQSMDDFNWKEVVDEAESSMPVFTKILKTAFPGDVSKGKTKGPNQNKRYVHYIDTENVIFPVQSVPIRTGSRTTHSQ